MNHKYSFKEKVLSRSRSYNGAPKQPRIVTVEALGVDKRTLADFEKLLEEFDPAMAAAWHEHGHTILFDKKYRTNGKDETIFHFVAKKLDINLAMVLMNIHDFQRLCLLKGPKRDPLSGWLTDILSTHSIYDFGSFVLTTNNRGESALCQCLKQLAVAHVRDDLDRMIRVFFESYVISEDTNQVVQKVDDNDGRSNERPILHYLIDKEQFMLICHFIRIYEDDRAWEYDSDEVIQFDLRDSFGRTALMAALEHGHVNTCKLLFNKSKDYLMDAKATKELILCMERETDPLKKAIFENKIVYIDPKDFQDLSQVACLASGQLTKEVNGATFEDLWLSVTAAGGSNDMVGTWVSDQDKLAQLREATMKLSSEFMLVILVVYNLNESYYQLDDFIRRLPYNFKLVVISTAHACYFDFGDLVIKQIDYVKQ